ncbi:hypothetical protein OG618_37610 (plasmid) [Kitasatospora sp. NBC_01246]|uniref:hypothetical protein n=1 Tax=Kitasatospora sp. NBC_01246 TaxID=2903570 RepID=UPI002E32E8D4|nr:hypothetical protein [Kitasatospora sp. NBC_01246]
MTHPLRSIATDALSSSASPLQIQQGIVAALVRLGDLVADADQDSAEILAASQRERAAERAAQQEAEARELELEDQALAVLQSAGPTGVTDPQFAELLAASGLSVERRQRQDWLERWSWGVNAVKRPHGDGLYSFVHAAHVGPVA